MDDLLELQQALYTSKNPTRRWLHCSRRDRIEADLRRASTAGPHRRVLEVGPGSGVYLRLLARLFDEVVASDVEETFLEHARTLSAELPNLTVVADDITHTKLSEASFDVVLCSEVIEHIADSPAALAGMRRLLRPGGYLVLSTPQRHSPLELVAKIAFLPGIIAIVRLVYREPILATGHVNLLTPRQAQDQLAAAGFEVIDHAVSGVYIPVVAELTGRFGLGLEQWLEPKMTRTRLRPLLWEQYYVARA